MIIYRYLSRQLFVTTLTVSFVLVFILVGGRFLKYMEEAAEGRIAGDVLLGIMLFRLPNFLEMILPLGLFLGILLAYGRLYTDNEMSILQTAGLGNRQLLTLTLPPVVCMMVVVGVLSLGLGPWGMYHSERILAEQKSQSGLNTLTPGRFHGARYQDYVIYVESIDDEAEALQNVYMVQQLPESVVVVSADRGHVVYDEKQGRRLLELADGRRYEGGAGQGDFTVMDYATYQMKLDDSAEAIEIDELKAVSSRELSRRDDLASTVELQWRWSLPLLVPIIACIAIPLSRVSPRQGRYAHIFPSILIYLAYLSVLSGTKGAVESGKIPQAYGLWWVHGLFVVVAALLFSGEWLRRVRLKQR